MFSPEQVDLALFQAGIVLGAFSGPLLTVFRSIFEADDTAYAKAALLTVVATALFFVAAFMALINDAMSVEGTWLWVPAGLLIVGLIILVPSLLFATDLSISVIRKHPPPKTTT